MSTKALRSSRIRVRGAGCGPGLDWIGLGFQGFGCSGQMYFIGGSDLVKLYAERRLTASEMRIMGFRLWPAAESLWNWMLNGFTGLAMLVKSYIPPILIYHLWGPSGTGRARGGEGVFVVGKKLDNCRGAFGLRVAAILIKIYWFTAE